VYFIWYYIGGAEHTPLYYEFNVGVPRIKYQTNISLTLWEFKYLLIIIATDGARIPPILLAKWVGFQSL